MTAAERSAFPHLLLPGLMTPEAMIAELAGVEPVNFGKLLESSRSRFEDSRKFAAQRGLSIDEASSLFGTASRDYGRGLFELLMQSYDCPAVFERRTQGGGTVEVRQPYMSILGVSTPARMAPYMKPQAWMDGTFARFLVATPDEPRNRERGNPRASAVHIVTTLGNLSAKLSGIPIVDPKGVEIESEAVNILYEYSDALDDMIDEGLDERLKGNYSRLPTVAAKCALLLATADANGQPDESHPGWKPEITVLHVRLAVEFVERLRESLHRATQMGSVAYMGTIEQRALRLITESIVLGHDRAILGIGITRRDIGGRIQNVPRDDLNKALKNLVAAGEIELVTYEGSRTSHYVPIL